MGKEGGAQAEGTGRAKSTSYNTLLAGGNNRDQSRTDDRRGVLLLRLFKIEKTVDSTQPQQNRCCCCCVRVGDSQLHEVKTLSSPVNQQQ